MDARRQVTKDVFFMEYENNAVIEVDENNLVVYVKENKIPVTARSWRKPLDYCQLTVKVQGVIREIQKATDSS